MLGFLLKRYVFLMKMSNFYTQKTVVRPKNSQVFTLGNEAKEDELSLKISDLEQKIGTLEQIQVKKWEMESQIDIQRKRLQEELTMNQNLEKQVSDLTAKVALQERSLLQFDSFQQENKRLSDSNGQATHDLANMRFELGEQTQELERLRTHNADLDINHRSMLNATQNKEDMIRDLTQALTRLQEQHQSLTDSSNILVSNFRALSEARVQLDDTNLNLHGQVIVLKQQQESASQQEKVNLQRRGEQVEQRIRQTMAGQMQELNQDVADLQRINAYYKHELSKPQHMSISAIARQEGFKMPLASSAINYRKNNLGTGQATLLRFGNKES